MLLLMVGCKSNHKEGKISTANNKQKYYYTLTPIDTVFISLTENTSYKNVFRVEVVDEKEYLTTLNYKKNLLSIYNIENGKIFKVIKFDKTGSNGIGIIRFALIHNWDSIFTIRYHTNRLALLDSTGKVNARYKITKTSLGESVFNVSAFSNFPLEYNRKKLFMLHISSAPVFSKGFWKTKTGLIYDLNTRKAENKIGAYPAIYRRGINFGGYSLRPYRIINKKGESIYTFSLENRLYVYNYKYLIKTVSIPSVYVKNVHPKPQRKLTGYNRKDDWLYEMSRGSYRWMVYDKYHNMIYRLVLHSMPAYDGEGNRNKWEDKPFSIQIIDSNFRLVGEVPFPGKTYYFRNIMASKSGLLISLSNDKNPITEENKLILARFKLVKKK